jgi:hypothetical protein
MLHREYLIAPVVEGHGEVEAVPVLLNNWFRFRRFTNFRSLDKAVRTPGAKALLAPYDRERQLGIEYYVRLAAGSRPDAILVILDADDECHDRTTRQPYQPLGPALLQRATDIMPHIPVGVVVANREFESWFIAGYRRLRTKKLLPYAAHLPVDLDVEHPRDCKGYMTQLMGREYSPTADQKAFAESITFRRYMRKKSDSFDKLVRELERLTAQARLRRRPRIDFR